MSKVEIYSTQTCPYCVRAKRLLTAKGVEYIDYDVSNNPDLRAAMTARAHGGRTVPQIFIDDEHVGGCDDLHSMDADGELDEMLGKAPAC